MESARNGLRPGLVLVSGIVRAVILPATLLLVPGLAPGLRPDPLTVVRDAVRTALAELTSDGRLPLVLAHGPALRHGLLRPSLAGSGVDDRWLPEPAGVWRTTQDALRGAQDARRTAQGAPRADAARPPAGTGASVALLVLADVLGERAADVETLEVPPDDTLLEDQLDGHLHGDGAADLLRGAAGLVVAGGGVPGGLDSGPGALTDGIRAALRLAGGDAWDADVQEFGQAHDHLPPSYQVTTLT